MGTIKLIIQQAFPGFPGLNLVFFFSLKQLLVEQSQRATRAGKYE